MAGHTELAFEIAIEAGLLATGAYRDSTRTRLLTRSGLFQSAEKILAISRK